MNNQSTVNELIELKLSPMADEFRIQENDPAMKKLSFDERFGLIVDAQYCARNNNRLRNLIRNAEFDQPEAHIAEIDYHSGRKLNKDLIMRLAKCEYITDYRNVFITGATGSGKTYMACAFGMEACKHYFKTKYVRLPDLLIEIEMSRRDHTYPKTLKKYTSPALLIIDEWLLLKPNEAEQNDIFELLQKRRKKSATIFCSQYIYQGWYEQLGGNASPLADAIMDRIKHDAYIINITSEDPSRDISMREIYGLKDSERE